MAENRHIQNTRTTRRNTRVFDKATTTNATPLVVASIPLAENRVSRFSLEVVAIKSDYTAAQEMDVVAVFRRAAGGNIARSTNTNGLGLPRLLSGGDFTGIAPSVNLVANTSTQSIDVTVTGKASTTIYWHFISLSIQNID